MIHNTTALQVRSLFSGVDIFISFWPWRTAVAAAAAADFSAAAAAAAAAAARHPARPVPFWSTSAYFNAHVAGIKED